MEIRVLTFNMQFGQIWDAEEPDAAPINLQRTIDELTAIDADIVLLQEVEQVSTASGQVQPPPNYTRLRNAMPHYHGFFSYPPHDARELPFGYGLAILSRNPIFDSERLELPAAQVDFEFEGKVTQPTERLMIAAKTKIGDQIVQLFNTHLQAFFMIDRSSDDFPQQRDLILARVQEATLPAILGGDFNVAPTERTVEVLESAGFRTAQRDKVTWKRMPFTVDHIFFNDGFVLRDCEVVPTNAADHEIVVATLELKKVPRLV